MVFGRQGISIPLSSITDGLFSGKLTDILSNMLQQPIYLIVVVNIDHITAKQQVTIFERFND